jgi:hypothetical protein
MQRHIPLALFLGLTFTAACGKSSADDTKVAPKKTPKNPIEPASNEPYKLGNVTFTIPENLTIDTNQSDRTTLALFDKKVDQGATVFLGTIASPKTKEACTKMAHGLSEGGKLLGVKLVEHERLGAMCMLQNTNGEMNGTTALIPRKGGVVSVSCQYSRKLDEPPAYCKELVASVAAE